jgi:hypothetical protein
MRMTYRDILCWDETNAAEVNRIFTRGPSGIAGAECVPLAWEEADSYNPATLPRRFFSRDKSIDAPPLTGRAIGSAVDVKTAGTEFQDIKSLHFS